MSDVADAFRRRFWRLDPLVANGLTFKNAFKQILWERLYSEIGADWILGRFAYLFGVGLERLQPCLDCWIPVKAERSSDRMILSGNTLGALLVMEHQGPVDETVHVLDPVTGCHWSDPRVGLVSLFGAWLPEELIPRFLDHGLYDQWVRLHGRLAGGEIIVPGPGFGAGRTVSLEDL